MPGVVEEHPGFVEAIVSSQAVCSCGWMQQGTAKHPKAHATPLGVWMSLLEEKSIFLHKSFELGTLKPCGCSQKCVPVQCPLAVAVLHRGNVLGRAAPTGISAEFSNELRINLYCARESFAPAAALGWFGPAGPRHWKETDPALGAAVCLPCSETLNSLGASRKSSPGCYGRIKNPPNHRAARLLPMDQMCGFLWDSSSFH